MSPLITLTTDFGVSSPYVAAMKGVILSLNPAATLVDLTHAIPPQDIRQGALALVETTRWFPPGSIHVAVIDPGVGTNRGIVYAEIAGRHYLAPDNGLLSGLARAAAPARMHALTNRAHWLPAVSSTFHGRDILAPAAAHLSLGLDPRELGPEQAELVQIPWAEVRIVPGKIEGTIQKVDTFGNLISDITVDMLADAPRDESLTIHCDDHETHGLFAAYGEQPPMTLIALIGSSGFLELAIVNDSAHLMLGVRPGTPIRVKW